MKSILTLLLILLPCFSYSQNYYAVLITGSLPNAEVEGAECWNRDFTNAFWNDTYLTWELLYENGFSNNNIFVLFGDGRDWYPYDPGDNTRYNPLWRHGIEEITDYEAKIADVENIFTWLANGNPQKGIPKLTSEDVLFVWTFGHGNSIGGCTSTLYLMDGQMYDYDFAALVDQVAYSKRIFWMQQCYSGGFIDNLENDKTVILTASACNQMAPPADDRNPDGDDELENEIYNGVKYYHGEFNYHVMNAVRKKTIVNNPIPSDTNNDGEISVLEAKEWEFEKDSWTSVDPQYSDIGNIGASSFLVPLIKLVNKNKSISSDATGLNGGRRIVKDSNNHYHFVFSSDNKIFYRKSSNSGQTWSSSELLQTNPGQNNYPGIAFHNNFLFVTWQRYSGYENNQHLYKIEGVYKQLSDNLWSPMLITGGDISFSTQINPLPVIVAADNVDDNYNSADNAPEVMIVFRKADGIYHSNLFYSMYQENEAMFTYQQLSSTSKIGNTAAGFSNPSVTVNEYERIIVTCHSTSGTLHAYRTTGGAWYSYLSSIFNSLYFDDYKNSSVTTNVTDDFHIVWEGIDDAFNKAILHKRITYQGWPSGPVSEFIDFTDSKQPSVYGHTDINYGVSIYWHNDNNIRKVVYNGTKWGSSETSKINSVHVNTLARGISWQEVFSWTGVQGPLYNYGVNFNDIVPKRSQDNFDGDDSIRVLTYRKSELKNEQLNISVSLQMGNFKLITSNGEEYPLDVDLLEPDFSFKTLGDILATMRSNIIPGNISFERVMIEYQIRAQNVNLMQINNNNRPRFNFILSNRGNGNIIHTTNEIIINADSTIQIISGTVEIPINGNNLNNPLGVAMRLQGVRQNFLNYTDGINLINSYVLIPEDNYRVNLEKQPLVKSSYSLEQNYPNPFNPVTQIQYSILQEGLVTLKVFDILGQKIATLVNENKPEGYYEVVFDASSLPSGVYFYSISTKDFHQVKKMLMIK
jgi:hypothetical protein